MPTLTDAQKSEILFALADALLMRSPHTAMLAPALIPFTEAISVGTADMVRGKKKGKKAVSAYNKAFGKAFKRQKDRMTKKNGDWKKGCNGKKCMTAAHKETKKLLKRL